MADFLPRTPSQQLQFTGHGLDFHRKFKRNGRDQEISAFQAKIWATWKTEFDARLFARIPHRGAAEDHVDLTLNLLSNRDKVRVIDRPDWLGISSHAFASKVGRGSRVDMFPFSANNPLPLNEDYLKELDYITRATRQSEIAIHSTEYDYKNPLFWEGVKEKKDIEAIVIKIPVDWSDGISDPLIESWVNAARYANTQCPGRGRWCITAVLPSPHRPGLSDMASHLADKVLRRTETKSIFLRVESKKKTYVFHGDFGDVSNNQYVRLTLKNERKEEREEEEEKGEEEVKRRGSYESKAIDAGLDRKRRDDMRRRKKGKQILLLPMNETQKQKFDEKTQEREVRVSEMEDAIRRGDEDAAIQARDEATELAYSIRETRNTKTKQLHIQQSLMKRARKEGDKEGEERASTEINRLILKRGETKSSIQYPESERVVFIYESSRIGIIEWPTKTRRDEKSEAGVWYDRFKESGGSNYFDTIRVEYKTKRSDEKKVAYYGRQTTKEKIHIFNIASDEDRVILFSRLSLVKPMNIEFQRLLLSELKVERRLYLLSLLWRLDRRGFLRLYMLFPPMNRSVAERKRWIEEEELAKTNKEFRLSRMAINNNVFFRIEMSRNIMRSHKRLYEEIGMESERHSKLVSPDEIDQWLASEFKLAHSITRNIYRYLQLTISSEATRADPGPSDISIKNLLKLNPGTRFEKLDETSTGFETRWRMVYVHENDPKGKRRVGEFQRVSATAMRVVQGNRQKKRDPWFKFYGYESFDRTKNYPSDQPLPSPSCRDLSYTNALRLAGDIRLLTNSWSDERVVLEVYAGYGSTTLALRTLLRDERDFPVNIAKRVTPSDMKQYNEKERKRLSKLDTTRRKILSVLVEQKRKQEKTRDASGWMGVGHTTRFNIIYMNIDWPCMKLSEEEEQTYGQWETHRFVHRNPTIRRIERKLEGLTRLHKIQSEIHEMVNDCIHHPFEVDRPNVYDIASVFSFAVPRYRSRPPNKGVDIKTGEVDERDQEIVQFFPASTTIDRDLKWLIGHNHPLSHRVVVAVHGGLYFVYILVCDPVAKKHEIFADDKACERFLVQELRGEIYHREFAFLSHKETFQFISN